MHEAWSESFRQGPGRLPPLPKAAQPGYSWHLHSPGRLVMVSCPVTPAAPDGVALALPWNPTPSSLSAPPGYRMPGFQPMSWRDVCGVWFTVWHDRGVLTVDLHTASCPRSGCKDMRVSIPVLLIKPSSFCLRPSCQPFSPLIHQF